MGRPRDPNARRHPLSARFSDADINDMDTRRAHLTPSDYLRWCVKKIRELDLHVAKDDRP